MSAKRSRPEANRAATKEHSGEKFNGPSSIPQPADVLQRARRHDYALLVVSQRRDGVVVSQVFTSMHPAERKLARCRERGLPASMTLVRLVPAAVSIDPADMIGGDL